ncbi:MAG: ATP-binding protein [Acidobacteriota bacterium]
MKKSGRKTKSELIAELKKLHASNADQAKLAAQFLRAQRMESIGALASGIAHDLNNQLAPILLGLQILHKRLKDEESVRILTTLEESVKRGREVIRQVLSFARGMEGKRVDLHPKHIILELAKIIRETFPKSINIDVVIAKDLWMVSGDTTQLCQVLMNLCVNARDAMPMGGSLKITTANVVLGKNYGNIVEEAGTGRFVLISVSDTGKGIPWEIRDKIFEPFFTTKDIGKGTGLGLSTSLMIVKDHEGFISVDSEVNRGTTFKVYLPACVGEQTVEQIEEKECPLPVGQGEKILVVDDEIAVREVAQTILEAYGYKVITAEDGREAIVTYIQHTSSVKLILMDMVMPNLDGIVTAKILEMLNPQVKIISTSGYVADGIDEKIDEVVAIKAVLVKPYTAQRLLETVAQVLGRECQEQCFPAQA